VKSHAFELETSTKRLDRLETALCGLRSAGASCDRVSAVTTREAKEAIGQRLSARELSIVLVASATDELLAGLTDLRGVRTVERVSFDVV
jgi:hypothetical protein